MKKVLLIASILFGWISAHAQDFAPSDSYLYGVGISFSEESADSTAMLSLSRSIHTRVTSESERIVSEVNGKYSDSFTKRTGLSSSIGISGAKKDVSVNADGQYVVYRYIDKYAYVKERLDRYSEYMELGRKYDGNPFKDTVKHRINLGLGAYYRAYETTVDTTGLFTVLYGKEKVERLRETAIENIRSLYYKNWLEIPVANVDRYKGDCPYRVVYAYSGQTVTHYLYGFEYFDGKVWRKPVSFHEENDGMYSNPYNDDSVGEMQFEAAFIEFTPKMNDRRQYEMPEWRWLFEEKIGNVYVKIDVPEWMYYLIDGNKWYINV